MDEEIPKLYEDNCFEENGKLLRYFYYNPADDNDNTCEVDSNVDIDKKYTVNCGDCSPGF